MEKSDKIRRIKDVRKFDKQNFDELIVAFIGKVLTEKIGRENFDESLVIRQTFPPSKFCAIYSIQQSGFTIKINAIIYCIMGNVGGGKFCEWFAKVLPSKVLYFLK